MAQQETFDLHPSGWENDPEEERFKLSLFDPIILVVYCHFALYFRLDDTSAAAKTTTARVLGAGLAKTLSQVRHLCGTIEPEAGGGFAFVKKRATTVRYVVKHLDDAAHPSMDELERASFTCRALGPDLGEWAVPGMPYGEARPESDPYNSPVTSGFQLNFVRGGAVFSSHVHHWAADLVGWSNFVRQLADNCRAVHLHIKGDPAAGLSPSPNSPPGNPTSTSSPNWPPWDPACIDVSRFVGAPLPPEALVDGPPVAPPHPGHPADQQALLFHLSGDGARELKARAAATLLRDDAPWISTYDAMCAFVWRTLTRLRVRHVYDDVELAAQAPYFAESVDMRGRFRDPTPPPRMVRNMLTGGFSDVATHLPLPTIGEVANLPTGAGDAGTHQDVPLSRLALYVRRLTDSVTQAGVERVLAYIATLRDQRSVSFNLVSKPPLSFFVTDHRTADVAGCDFGFARPLTHRFLAGSSISPNMVLVYPPARGDDGTVWSITVEKELVPHLLADPEWCEFFAYKGVD